MMQKTIFITGAGRGIGFEIANQLHALGHRVVMGVRSMERAEKTLAEHPFPGQRPLVVQCDITRQIEIDAAATTIKNNFGNLDVLMNNAAILLKSDRNILTDDKNIFDQTILTNATSHLMVTRSMLPLMRAGSRIINTSSEGGSMSDPVGGWSPAYCISKSMLNAITRHLAYTLAEKKISVNAFCPGWVKTEMGGRSAPLTVQQGADTAVWLATADYIPTGKFFKNRKEIPW